MSFVPPSDPRLQKEFARQHDAELEQRAARRRESHVDDVPSVNIFARIRAALRARRTRETGPFEP